MCGIITMILKDQNKVLGKEYSEMFKQMLHADAVRGWDSTGIACVKNTDKVQIVKDACTPQELFMFVADNTWIFNNRAYIGHNRWATRGKTNAANAHPFQEGDISLVHNGTLRFHMFLKNVEVDSHAITHAIAEKGAINTLEVLDGAYALVWYNEATGNIQATRNTERPLFLLETDDLFLLSSERGLVYWICERFQVKVRKCTPLTPGVLYSFRANKKDMTIIEQTKYTILEQVQYFQQQTQPPLLPTVSQIRPHQDPIKDYGLKVGQTLQVVPFEMKDLGFKCFNLGNLKWSCQSLHYPNHRIELYTDKADLDKLDHPIIVTITNIYPNPALPTLITKLEEPVEKKTDAGPLSHIASINGIVLTPAVIDKAKDCLCAACTGPFEYRSDIVLVPVYRKNHLYRYTYYCPDCAEIVQPTQQRAFH